MIATVSVLLIVAVSLLLTRIATVALVHTGMGRESARFQARSAFTGVGFTTSEAESVFAHPLRRRIVMWLMLVGNAGIVSGIVSLVFSFVDMRSSDSAVIRLAALSGGLVGLSWIGSSAWVDAWLCSAISWALRRWTDIDARDYARLLHLRGDYGVTELAIGADDWLAERSLAESGLDGEGILILGVECPGGHFIGAPAADTALRAGDRLILYGRMSRIAEIDRRAMGEAADRSHREALAEQQRIHAEERAAAGR